MSDRVKAVLQLSYEDSHVNTFARNAVATNDPNLCCRTVSRGAPSGYGTLYRGELHTDPNEDFTYDPRAFAGDSEAVPGNMTVTAEGANLMLPAISGYEHTKLGKTSGRGRGWQ